MATEAPPPAESEQDPPRPPERPEGLPLWLTAAVVLTLLACFAYNLVAFGVAGVPMATVIAGLMGAYGGLDQLAKARKQREREGPKQ